MSPTAASAAAAPCPSAARRCDRLPSRPGSRLPNASSRRRLAWPRRRRRPRERLNSNDVGCSRGKSFSGPLQTELKGAAPTLTIAHQGDIGLGIKSTVSVPAGTELGRMRATISKFLPDSASSLCSKDAGLHRHLERLKKKEVEPSVYSTAVLLVLERYAKSSDTDLFKLLEYLPRGPTHWLDLPGPRAGLEARAQQVRSLLAGAFETMLEEVMRADLRRIASTLSANRPDLASTLLLQFAFLNHSCCPNAKLVFDGDCWRLIALRDIAEGEFVEVSYINEYEDLLSRRYYLLKGYGFRCLCVRCQGNFSGASLPETDGGSWLCSSCKTAISDCDFVCSACQTVVSKETRLGRTHHKRLCLTRLEALAQRFRTDPREAQAHIAAMLQIVQELKRHSPPQSPSIFSALQKIWSFIRAFGSGLGSDTVSQLKTALADTQDGLSKHIARETLEGSQALLRQASLEVDQKPWADRLLKALRLFDPPREALDLGGKKVRVGPRGDGGYVIWVAPGPGGKPSEISGISGSSGSMIRHVLSYGVDTNVDFEYELAVGGAKVSMFDHTVEAPPKRHPNMTFNQEALASTSVRDVCGTLEEHSRQLLGNSSNPPSALLKMDVEGAEYDVFLSIPREVLKRYGQLCLELHWLGRPTRCGDFRTKALALEKLSQDFVLLHAHGNNYGDVVTINSMAVPDVLEVLYVNRAWLGAGHTPSPAGLRPDPSLDSSNCEFLADLHLPGAPFGPVVGDTSGSEQHEEGWTIEG